MSLKILATYFVAWLIVVLTPGPAVFCVMGQSTRFGFRASLRGLAGLQTVSVIFFLCVALGLGAVLATATTTFAIIRTLGALYLLYLGGRMIVGSFRKPSRPDAIVASEPANHRGLYLQGVLVQATNPKALLFMGAFLPQFIDPDHFLLQLGILLIPTIVLDSIVQAAYAYVAQHGARSFRSSGVSAWLDRTLGAALVFFGVRMLLSSR